MDGRYLTKRAKTDKGRDGVYCNLSTDTGHRPAMRCTTTLKFDPIRKELPGIFLTLGLVAALTAVLFALVWESGLAPRFRGLSDPGGDRGHALGHRAGACRRRLRRACIGLSSSTRRSTASASRIRRKSSTSSLFIFVAVAVSQLATRLKRQLEMARQREIDLRDLYAFSRRLAVAFDVSDIHAAIEDHLASVMQRNVVLFSGAREASDSSGRRAGATVPQQCSRRSCRSRLGRAMTPPAARLSRPKAERSGWCARSRRKASNSASSPSISAAKSKERSDELRVRVDAVLADATATLERLGVAHAISEARMRSQTDQLREALIGSVSHELRTPLASILGAATVLSAAPALRQREEAEGARARRARRGRAPQQRHPEPARCHAHQQRRRQAARRMGGSGRHHQFGAWSGAAIACRTTASCSICRPTCR